MDIQQFPVPEERYADQKAIHSYLRSEDYKQAIKTIDKRLPKIDKIREFEKESWLKALKTYAQARSMSIVDRSNAGAYLRKLGLEKAEFIITDLEELDIYENAADLLSQNADTPEFIDLVSQMRFNSAKKISAQKTKNIPFLEECFEHFVKNGRWNFAQLTCSFLTKADPQNAKWIYWSAVCLKFYSRVCPNQQHGSMFATLAFKKIETLAEANKKCEVGKELPEMALHTIQELLFYYEAAKDSDEKVLKSSLLSPQIGYASYIAKGSILIMKEAIKMLEKDKNWSTIHGLCYRLLDGACANDDGIVKDPKGADWAVWTSYIDSILHLKQKDLLEQFRQMVKKHLSQDLGVNKTYRRNARLALVHFQTSFNPKGESFVKTVMGFPYRWQQYIIHQAKGDGTLPQQLVKVVDTGVSDRVCFLLEYLIEYCHFSGVVGDIEPYFKQLSADEKAIVLKHAKLIMVDGRALVFIEPGDEFVLGESTPIAPAVSSRKSDEIHSEVSFFKLKVMAEAFALDELFGAAAPVSTVTDSPGGSLATEKPKHWCPYCGTTSDSEEEAGIRHTMCENIANRMASENLALYIRAVKGCSRKEWLPLNVLKTDMHPGDGAAIMAAIHLIKLGATPYVGLAINIKSEDLAFLRRNGTKRLVQAAALLEFAHANSPANPQILLLLIRLYSYLGAGSLAMRSFKRLNLKRIQLDTLGYMLFDRLSTLHPHSWNDKTYSDSSEVFNHRIMLEKVHFEYKRFQDETQKNLMRSFDNGSYYSVFQLESASQNISHSLGAVLSVVELRSNHRMIKPTTPFSRYNYGYEILPQNILRLDELKDNLDCKNFPNYELPGNIPFVELFSLGPKPTEVRMQGELLIDHVWMVLNSANQDTPTMNELIHWLDQNYNFPEAFIKTQSDALHHLTRLEYCHLQLATLIRGCIVHVCIDTKKIPTMSMAKGTVLYPLDTVLAISSILITVKSTVQDVPLLVEGQGEDYIPDFKNTLHILYKAYQICLFVLASESFFTHLNVPGSVFSKKYYTDNIGNPVRAIVNKIKDVAKKVAKVVNADGVYYRKVVDWIGEGAEKNSEKSEDVEGTDTIGKALLGLLNSDKDFIQEFALDLSESWSESVQGLQVLH